jgi:2-dehydropantoate 2-reductase
LRVGIFGTGAIGSLLAFKLSKTGNKPFIYSRGESLLALQERGIIVHSHDSIHVLTPIEYSILDSKQNLDIAIICCKQNSVSELVMIAENQLASDGVVIAIQNGLGHLNRIASVVGKGRVIGACVTHGSNRIGPVEIRLGGEGKIVIGPLDPEKFSVRTGLYEKVIEMLDEANLSPVPVANILPSIWEKLLLNLAINPISAICGVRNGVLLSSPLNELAISVMREGVMVAEYEGINIDFEKLENSLNEVLKATAENRCSMLQDVMHGVPTEVDWICGAIVEKAEIHGIPVPMTQTLWNLVHGLSM